MVPSSNRRRRESLKGTGGGTTRGKEVQSGPQLHHDGDLNGGDGRTEKPSQLRKEFVRKD